MAGILRSVSIALLVVLTIPALALAQASDQTPSGVTQAIVPATKSAHAPLTTDQTKSATHGEAVAETSIASAPGQLPKTGGVPEFFLPLAVILGLACIVVGIAISRKART